MCYRGGKKASKVCCKRRTGSKSNLLGILGGVKCSRVRWELDGIKHLDGTEDLVINRRHIKSAVTESTALATGGRAASKTWQRQRGGAQEKRGRGYHLFVGRWGRKMTYVTRPLQK